MNALYNIPAHTRCKNCGRCCGPVPITYEEYEQIRDYVAHCKYAREESRKYHPAQVCVFRDPEKMRCAIYPVRPLVCQLFGVTRGMKCPEGNSDEIDGRKFFTGKEAIYGMMNDVDWGAECEQ